MSRLYFILQMIRVFVEEIFFHWELRKFCYFSSEYFAKNAFLDTDFGGFETGSPPKLLSRFMTFIRACAEIKKSLDFSIFELFFPVSFFSFSFLFAAVIDLLLAFLAAPSSRSLWSDHWKDLFLLQKLSIDDANFVQKWWRHAEVEERPRLVTGVAVICVPPYTYH